MDYLYALSLYSPFSITHLFFHTPVSRLRLPVTSLFNLTTHPFLFTLLNLNPSPFLFPPFTLSLRPHSWKRGRVPSYMKTSSLRTGAVVYNQLSNIRKHFTSLLDFQIGDIAKRHNIFTPIARPTKCYNLVAVNLCF